LITENLSTLKIHKLTKAQYDRELAAGNIDANALYLTPDDGGLPAVTTADNGKVLMVVDGAWKLVQLNLSVDANGVVSVG
jgi:hypothetical protein